MVDRPPEDLFIELRDAATSAGITGAAGWKLMGPTQEGGHGWRVVDPEGFHLFVLGVSADAVRQRVEILVEHYNTVAETIKKEGSTDGD